MKLSAKKRSGDVLLSSRKVLGKGELLVIRGFILLLFTIMLFVAPAVFEVAASSQFLVERILLLIGLLYICTVPSIMFLLTLKKVFINKNTIVFSVLFFQAIFFLVFAGVRWFIGKNFLFMIVMGSLFATQAALRFYEYRKKQQTKNR